MCRSILKISFLSVLILNNNGLLLAMKHEVVVYKNPSLPLDLMIRVAAEGDGEVKNKLRKTCGFFSKTCTQDNIAFLSHPSFCAHKKDIEDMVCSAAWFNNVAKEQVLARYNIEKINFTTTFVPNSLKPNSSIGLSVNTLKPLRNKYNNSDNTPLALYELTSEIEPAFYCAVQCNDFEAINNIAPKIKLYISYDLTPHAMDTHKCLLMQVIQKDREELFKVVVKNDPVKALNLYSNQSNDPSDQLPFLDALMNADYIPQDLKDKYSSIYRECGGKTFDELEEEKRKNCIIS